jgi:hypothetical protein
MKVSVNEESKDGKGTSTGVTEERTLNPKSNPSVVNACQP